jgi:hypothetical protein
MVPLITDMTQEEPSKRPSIDEVMARFETIYRSLSFKLLRTRMVARDEYEGDSAFYDFLYFFRRMRYAFMRIPPVPRAGMACYHTDAHENLLILHFSSFEGAVVISWWKCCTYVSLDTWAGSLGI